MGRKAQSHLERRVRSTRGQGHTTRGLYVLPSTRPAASRAASVVGPVGLKQKLGWRVLAPSAGVEAEERSAARRACAEDKAGEAGRQRTCASWPRLAEAGGCPEPGLALAGRVLKPSWRARWARPVGGGCAQGAVRRGRARRRRGAASNRGRRGRRARCARRARSARRRGGWRAPRAARRGRSAPPRHSQHRQGEWSHGVEPW